MRSKRPPVLDEEAARERCLRLLGLRSRSEAELRQRLRMLGFEHNTIEGVLADLERAGLVDDAEFARTWVEQRTASGTGPHRLRAELRRKGVRDDLIRRVVDEAIDDEAELEQALRLAERRLRGVAPDAPALLRLRRYLLGRGYSPGTVERLMRRLASQEDLSDAV